MIPLEKKNNKSLTINKLDFQTCVSAFFQYRKAILVVVKTGILIEFVSDVAANILPF